VIVIITILFQIQLAYTYNLLKLNENTSGSPLTLIHLGNYIMWFY